MPAFIKVPDIEGESQEQDHEGWIAVTSLSQPVYRSIQEGAVGAGRASGHTSLGDFTVTKVSDSSSPKLMEYCCNGKHLEEVVVHVCSTINGKNCVRQEFKLSDVIISGYSYVGTGDMDPPPSETVTMNFTEIWRTDKKFTRMGDEDGNFPAHYSTEAANS
jgi:type VI secretion system secreted protein Hcp